MDFHSLLRKAKDGLEDLLTDEQPHSHTHEADQCHEDATHAAHRYGSFAPQSSGHAKWYVDGASYFWAVSMALEEARESIYILDWWLSPELYLRRPPARNERYRLDSLLKAAAERGVRINVIVYKEVEAALTLNSIHTKHHLEALHPNIKVFRYPDHYPSGNSLVSGLQDLHTGLKNFSLKTFDLARASQDVIKNLYGTADDVVLFWAHHEKLCLVDGKVAFMGGLDMCFGRYDTNSHPIADVHPGNMDDIIFPGQDYNNARIYDFEDVERWENNKLDRTRSSRMGWSDIAVSLSGPIVHSLAAHFVQRWNYIFSKKYSTRDIGKYQRLQGPHPHHHPRNLLQDPRNLLQEGEEFLGGLQHRVSRHMHGFFGGEGAEPSGGSHQQQGAVHIQLTRSCSKWSLGVNTEHSIANAYIEAIKNAKHFVYIENQFFITATSDEQRPVVNKIGAAMVDRIIRAHQYSEDFQIVVVMPAVPAFAGDLKSDGALGTRAIMEFQYGSINRGRHSILEQLRGAGVADPHRYINFYNLRSYDRINTGAAMGRAEAESGVRYEDARREYDERYGGSGGRSAPRGDSQYRRYQEAAGRLSDATWDTISACYMESGPDLRSIPWTGPPEAELDAFVSEQLYVHSKVLIADDRLVICGSANLNDRSQLGDHDSEIAVVIEDPTPVDSRMGGQPYTASAFAASLRRQLYRKHLGLLPDQRPDAPDRNWTPVSHHDPANAYDWGSPADRLVRDPLSAEFVRLWRATARRNTEIFRRAFHAVPDDGVRTWDDYDRFFSRHFVVPGEPAEQAAEGYRQGKVDYGHVVRDEFPGGVDELKAWLGGVRGNLVEMPLQFLIDVDDLAKDGLALNGLTDELYT